MSWYVITAKNGRALKARDELEAKGIAVFLPMEQGYTRINGRRRKYRKPLLGRYMFVVADGSDEAFHDIRSTADVEAILPHQKPPEPILAGAVDALRQAEAEGMFDRTSRHHEFAAGDKVRIARGPFTGAMGEIRRKRGHQRWDLLITYLGRPGKAEAREEELELVA